jgi:hypothetical protein
MTYKRGPKMHAKKAPIHGFICLLPFEKNPRKYEK